MGDERSDHFGSSPRMWGTSESGELAVGIARFIPTYVGNIRLSGGWPYAVPVHPHVCGEHAIQRTCRGGIIGSSPRMWGTYLLCSFQRDGLRFIPTYVGNIFCWCAAGHDYAVHPHVCGEHMDCLPYQ